MRTSFLAAVVVATFTIQATSFAQVRTQQQILKEMTEASRLVVNSYKTEGMGQLAIISQDCFEKVNDFLCIYIDLASRHIDQSMSRLMGFPLNEYFDDSQFYKRIASIYSANNIAIDQANEHLRMATDSINKIIDSEIASSGKPDKKLPIIDGKWVISKKDCTNEYVDTAVRVEGNELYIWEGSCTVSDSEGIDDGAYKVELWCQSEGEQNIINNKFIVHNAYSFTWMSKFGSGDNVKYVRCE